MNSLKVAPVIDEDDWLCGYLSTTKYASDRRLTSNPTLPVKKVPAVKKKTQAYSLQVLKNAEKNSRRNSWNLSRSAVVVHPVVHPSAPLPDRVNVVREGNAPAYSTAVEGHFVREHVNGETYDLGGKGQSSRARRQTLDYDELEAVKER